MSSYQNQWGLYTSNRYILSSRKHSLPKRQQWGEPIFMAWKWSSGTCSFWKKQGAKTKTCMTSLARNVLTQLYTKDQTYFIQRIVTTGLQVTVTLFKLDGFPTFHRSKSRKKTPAEIWKNPRICPIHCCSLKNAMEGFFGIEKKTWLGRAFRILHRFIVPAFQ